LKICLLVPVAIGRGRRLRKMFLQLNDLKVFKSEGNNQKRQATAEAFNGNN